MFETGKTASEVVAELGLGRISDDTEAEVIQTVFNTLLLHLKRLDQIRDGNLGTQKSLMGEAMKALKGRADAQVVMKRLQMALDLAKAQLSSTSPSSEPLTRTWELGSAVTLSTSTAAVQKNLAESVVPVYPELLVGVPKHGTADPGPTTSPSPDKSKTNEE